MSSTRVTTKKARLSYCKIWQGEVKEGNKGETTVYSTAVLIPKSDTETIKALEAAIEAAKVAGKSKLEVNGKMPKLKLPLHDGDVDKPEDPAYAGHMYFNASTYGKKPSVVERKNGMFTEITDPARVYSGCFARVCVGAYAYNNTSKGISFGLQSVCFLSDGEPLGGSYVSAEEAFGDDFEDEDDLLG